MKKNSYELGTIVDNDITKAEKENPLEKHNETTKVEKFESYDKTIRDILQIVDGRRFFTKEFLEEQEVKEIHKKEYEKVIKKYLHDIHIGIMKLYQDGKLIAKTHENTIREILKIENNEKLPNIIIKKNGNEASYEENDVAIQEYNKGMKMMLEAREEMVQLLSNYIYYIMEKTFPTFKMHSKDLYQEGVIGILKGLDSYDATWTRPTTFFQVYILHEMNEYINLTINKTTSHYSASISKVKKAIDSFNKSGRQYTVTDIAQETEISAETILQSMKIMVNTNEVHYDSVDYLDSQISQNMASPEEEYLKNEANQALYRAVRGLPRNQVFIICLKYGERLSYKNISARLDLPIDKVKKEHNKALRYLKKCKLVNGHFNLKREDRAINKRELGVVPINIGESIMAQLELIEEI